MDHFCGSAVPPLLSRLVLVIGQRRMSQSDAVFTSIHRKFALLELVDEAWALDCLSDDGELGIHGLFWAPHHLPPFRILGLNCLLSSSHLSLRHRGAKRGIPRRQRRPEW